VQQPDLVLADEPASALDPALADRALALLGELARARGGALVASLHDPGLALRHCDRVVGLAGGRVGLAGGRVVLDRPTAALSPADLADLYGAPA
jgi:phosphonate transport system ATP-binding protein